MVIDCAVRRIIEEDAPLMDALRVLLGEVFEDLPTYTCIRLSAEADVLQDVAT